MTAGPARRQAGALLNLPMGIRMDEKTHRYTWQGKPLSGGSISGISKIADGDCFGVASGWAQKTIRQELSAQPMAALKMLASATPEVMKKWAMEIASAPNRARDVAAETGNLVHAHAQAVCEHLVEVSSTDEFGLPGSMPALPEGEGRAACEAVSKFIERHISPVAAEVRLLFWPPTVGGNPPEDTPIPGTCDLVCRLQDGGLCVLDWKTVNTIRAVKASHVAQLAAYGEALQQRGNKIDALILVQVERTSGRLEASRFDHTVAAADLFRLCLAIHQWRLPASTNLEEEKNYG